MDHGHYQLTITTPEQLTDAAREQVTERILQALRENERDQDFLGSYEFTWIPTERTCESGDETEFLERSSDGLQIFVSSTIACDIVRDLLCSEAEVTIQPVSDENWNESWADSFQGVDVESYWKIRPESSLSDVSRDSTTLYLNPSVGFGSGEHPTTRLCLEVLGSVELDQKHVLDFGSGSGILSFAAAKKGAQVQAVEMDQMALEESKRLSEINGVQHQIKFTSTLPSEEHYDVIVANILLNVLLAEGPRLIRHLRSKALLILSGILVSQIDELEGAYRGWFAEEKVEVSRSLKVCGDWACVLFSCSRSSNIPILTVVD